MSTFSSIRVVFGSDLIAGAQFGYIEGGSGNPFGGVPYSFFRIFNWVNLRSTNYQVTVGTPTLVNGERAAINFMAAAQLDLGAGYQISRLLNVVTIKVQNTFGGLTYFNWFQILQVNDIFTGELVTVCTTDPSISVTTEEAAENFAFESVTLSPSPGQECTHVRVTLNATQVIRALFSPFPLVGNTDDPLVFDWVRGNPINIIAANADGDTITRMMNLPSVLNPANFNIGILNSPNGSTVKISYVNTYNSHISWSLDGVFWQDFQFSGLAAGTYTLYVRDNYGCSFQTQFTTAAFHDVYAPVFYISKSNAFRFANRITFGDSSNYKNDENTLSCEENVKLPYKYTQLFHSADVITTQFKSNYTTNEVFILPPNAVSVAARSNMLLYSEDLTNAAWTKTNVTLDAEKVIANTTNGFHGIVQEINKGTTAGDYTLSFYIKKAEFDTIRMYVSKSVGSGYSLVDIDSNTGSASPGLSNAGFTFISASVTNEDNGYLRVSMKAALDTTDLIKIRIDVRDTSGNYQYVGNSVSGLFLDKFQFQEGDLTPYIQTTNAAVDVPATDGSISVPVIKKSDNIRVKDKRDAFVFGANGKTYVYFLAGNIYDYATGAITGTYALNGTLPIWGKVGNYISISGNWAVIEDTYFDEALNADVLVFTGAYSHVSDYNIVSSIFNIQDYEVYEFTIDLVAYLDQTFRIRINSNRDTLTELIHLTEAINVQVRQENTVEIKYWNSDNTDVFYSTGIRHLIRQPVINLAAINDQQSESNKTDTNIILLSADIYEGDEIIFDYVTREMMRKILIALSHEVVFINNVGYVKNDNIDVEGPLDDTNLYSIKAKMMKNGNVYNSRSIGISSDIYSPSNAQIVGLIQTDTGFVKY